MLLFLAISGIFVLGFINRAFHLFRHPWVGKDTFSHLWLAREIRDTGRLPKQLWGHPYPQPYDLPPFPHIFLAMWPVSFHRGLQYLAPLLDVVSGLMILAGCFAAFGPEVAVVALALYFFSPMGRDNYYSLSPRAFGNTFLIASLFSLFIFYETAWPPVLIFASLFCALVFLTHRLTLQSLVGVLIGLTVVLRSPAPAMVLAMGFVMAFVFTKGYLMKTLKGHFEFVATVAKSMKDPKIRSAQPAKFPNPLHLLFNLPVLILLPWFFFLDTGLNTSFFLIWAVSLVVLSLVWVLGEGYRHLANAVAPLSILTAVWVVHNSAYLVLWAFLAASLLFTAVKIWRLEKENTSFISGPLVEAFIWLKGHCQPEDMVLCLPFDIFQALFYFAGCNVLQAGGAQGMLFNRSVLYEKVKNGKIQELVDEYNVGWVLTVNKGGMPGKTVFTRGDIVINQI